MATTSWFLLYISFIFRAYVYKRWWVPLHRQLTRSTATTSSTSTFLLIGLGLRLPDPWCSSGRDMVICNTGPGWNECNLLYMLPVEM